MVKLLHVTTVCRTLEAFLLPYASHFRGCGWTVDCAANGVNESELCKKHFDNVFEIKWSRNPFAFWSNVSTIRRIAKVVDDGDYDIVHVHTPIASFLTRWAIRKLRSNGGLRVVYTAHGLHFFNGNSCIRNSIFTTFETMAARWTDDIILINEEDKDAIISKNIVHFGRVHHFPGIGLDLGQYNWDKVSGGDIEALRYELGLSDGEYIFLMIGNFDKNKRQKDLVRAFSMLKDAKAHLVFAGKGQLEGEIKQLANALGSGARIHFLGHRHDIPRLLRASVATVLPSGREGLPRCVMESMAMGVPVIGSCVRGTRDLLASGGGILFPVGDIIALRDAMRKIIDDPRAANAMGDQGRASIEAYDIESLIVLHEQLYRKYLG